MSPSSPTSPRSPKSPSSPCSPITSPDRWRRGRESQSFRSD
jgi:hypothetical protein